jgi:hypothetical protein
MRTLQRPQWGSNWAAQAALCSRWGVPFETRLREYELNVYRGPYTTPMWFHTVPFLVEEFTDPHNCAEPHGSRVASSISFIP